MLKKVNTIINGIIFEFIVRNVQLRADIIFTPQKTQLLHAVNAKLD